MTTTELIVIAVALLISIIGAIALKTMWEQMKAMRDLTLLKEPPQDHPKQAQPEPSITSPDALVALNVIIEKLEEGNRMQKRFLENIYGRPVTTLDDADADIMEKAEALRDRYPNLSFKEAMDKAKAINAYRTR